MAAPSALFPILCILLAISLGLTILAQLRYAAANYPKAWRSQLFLVGSSFACGCIMGVIILMRDFSGIAFVLGVLAFGLATALIYRVFFVQNVQHLFPKRSPTPDKDKV